jgi:UDP-glucose 4-epimerase
MIRDQVDVEKQARAYQQAHPDCRITILRPCSILGSNVNNFASRYLCRPACLTALGYDPLIQLVHEKDVLRAFQMVIEKDHPGVFNIVGEGVLPLLTILRLAGRLVIPIASTLLYPVVQTLWQANIAVVPPGYLDFLKYLWVADGEKAREEMGFEPQYSTRETVLSFAGMQRLKNINLH